MWLQLSSWPDSTNLCLDDKFSRAVDGVTEGEIRSETGKRRDDGFAHVRPVGYPRDTLLGSAELSRRPSGAPKDSKWEDRRMIPDNDL